MLLYLPPANSDSAKEEGSRSAMWYITVARRQPLLLQPRIPPCVAVNVIRVRLGYLYVTQIRIEALESCQYCLVEEELLLHYLLYTAQRHRISADI